MCWACEIRWVFLNAVIGAATIARCLPPWAKMPGTDYTVGEIVIAMFAGYKVFRRMAMNTGGHYGYDEEG